MVQKSKYPSVRRFGARYGRRVREKLGMVEKQANAPGKCPYCRNMKVKRIAAGIFECRKCSSKFTGKAYFVGKIKSQDAARGNIAVEEAPSEEEELLEEEYPEDDDYTKEEEDLKDGSFEGDEVPSEEEGPKPLEDQ